MNKVREIDESALCISRKKRGKGYHFFDENGAIITEKKTLQRLKGLVIPPMWADVMVCSLDDGHIQAIGRDAKGRKQYIYHSVYEKQRQEEKFKRLLSFSAVLPEIRKKAQKDLKQKGWGLTKLTALIILLLDEYGIRIGNKEYRRQNDSYGLTTLRRKHMTIKGDELMLSFMGKSGQEQEVHIDNEELIPLIKKSAEQPGYEIFRYKNEGGTYQDIDSDDVNRYIAHAMGNAYSSKDFRTWAANRLAIEFYPIALEAEEELSRKKFSNVVIKMVASELGNTPTICREYYVHPAIFCEIDNKSLPSPIPFKDSKSAYGLSASEKLAREVIAKSYG